MPPKKATPEGGRGESAPLFPNLAAASATTAPTPNTPTPSPLAAIVSAAAVTVSANPAPVETARPTSTPKGSHYSYLGAGAGKHNEWEQVSIHTAKCDICGLHNTSVLLRCMAGCSKQFCRGCIHMAAADGVHTPDLDKLDWTAPPSAPRGSKKTRGTGSARGRATSRAPAPYVPASTPNKNSKVTKPTTRKTTTLSKVERVLAEIEKRPASSASTSSLFVGQPGSSRPLLSQKSNSIDDGSDTEEDPMTDEQVLKAFSDKYAHPKRHGPISETLGQKRYPAPTNPGPGALGGLADVAENIRISQGWPAVEGSDVSKRQENGRGRAVDRPERDEPGPSSYRGPRPSSSSFSQPVESYWNSEWGNVIADEARRRQDDARLAAERTHNEERLTVWKRDPTLLKLRQEGKHDDAERIFLAAEALIRGKRGLN